MTQAFNLAQLANKVNTSGQLDASTGLVNTVPVANGGLALSTIAARSIPLANTANTYTTLTPGAGQSIRINAGNTAWEAFTPGTGTVTSITAGSGLTGGTITGSGTIALDVYTGTAPTNAAYPVGTTVILYGVVSVNTTLTLWSPPSAGGPFIQSGSQGSGSAALAGTWRARGAVPQTGCQNSFGTLMQRVA